MSDLNYSSVLDKIKEQAETLPDSWSGPIIASVETRHKWNEIAREFPALKEEYGYESALRILSNRYNCSTKNVDKIVTQKNPYKEIGKD